MASEIKTSQLCCLRMRLYSTLAGVIKVSLGHLQYHWSAGVVEIGCDLPAPVDLLELITWLHIALAGEYAVKVLLVFLA